MKVTKAKTLSTLLYRFGCFLPRLVASEQTRTTAHLFKVPHHSARCASSRWRYGALRALAQSEARR